MSRLKVGDVEVEGDFSLAELEVSALSVLEKARKIIGLDHGVALGFTNTEVSFQDGQGRTPDVELDLPSPPVYVP